MKTSAARRTRREAPATGRRLLREPALHFVLGGAALFALHAAVAPEAEPDEPVRRVEVSRELVEALRRQHELQTGAPADDAALRHLIDQHVEQEVLYREALALGLDRGDPVVRRRLVQKMSFMLEDQPIEPPDEATLAAWLETHAARYQEPERITFRHVFLRRESRDRAPAVLTDLQGGADPAGLGDPFVHGGHITHRTQKQVEGLFGAAFAEAIREAPAGRWAGPIESSYGVHLVQIEAVVPGRVPPLGEVRARVATDWTEHQRGAARARTLAELKARYEVQVP